ncbi:MAG: helix-turn-helix domain-containing protein [Oligosphaeraceae bacterium]|nr:helix-turn-helix domain-containing protein [Oligosphaeraceae bacterium]
MPANNEIGAKIRALRELRQVSVEELSERCHLPARQISKIEAGEIAASLTPLLQIARGLGVRLGTFLDDSECSGPVLARGNELGKTVRFAGSGDVQGLAFHPLAANKSDRNMEPFIIDVHQPANAQFEVSSHEGEEFIYVLSGAIEVVHGKERYLLQAGDSIYYDSIVPHHVHAAGAADAKLLAVVYAPH